MKKFVREVVAIIKGDDAEATGLKILRQADSALNTQIYSLRGDTMILEDSVTEAETNLKLALHNNGELITDRNLYVRNLLNAKNKLTEAKETLEIHLEKIKFLEEQQEEINED